MENDFKKSSNLGTGSSCQDPKNSPPLRCRASTTCWCCHLRFLAGVPSLKEDWKYSQKFRCVPITWDGLNICFTHDLRWFPLPKIIWRGRSGRYKLSRNIETWPNLVDGHTTTLQQRDLLHSSDIGERHSLDFGRQRICDMNQKFCGWHIIRSTSLVKHQVFWFGGYHGLPNSNPYSHAVRFKSLLPGHRWRSSHTPRPWPQRCWNAAATPTRWTWGI